MAYAAVWTAAAERAGSAGWGRGFERGVGASDHVPRTEYLQASAWRLCRQFESPCLEASPSVLVRVDPVRAYDPRNPFADRTSFEQSL